ncbi:MAG: flagellar hook-associated protein FlgK [Ignavibacteriae bacterium]|nr:flagellar hook-associated protein FlgK [Ignavibacteriota bacterium]
MTGFNSLEIGKRALQAQQTGLGVTSNNIANINTPGYARQTAIFTETSPTLIPTSGFIGTGVTVSAIKSFREEYFDREIRNNLSRKSGYEADDRTLQSIETVLREPSEYGLDDSITKFFSSFQELALEPESIPRRELALNAGQNLADEIRATATGLSELRGQTFDKLGTQIGTVNGLLKEIADLNRQITLAQAQSLDTTNTINNERSKRIEQLSQYAGTVFVSIDNHGLANVTIAGNSVVTGTFSATLKLNETISGTGERTAKIDLVDNGGTPLVTLSPDSGEFASALKHYNVTLDDKDTSGGFSVAKNLSDLAVAIVNKVNAASVTGFGLDDTVAPNRNFFASTSIDAFSIDLDAAVKGQPRNLPLANAAGVPGDNTVARGIAGIANDPTFLSGQTPANYYTSFLNKVANAGGDAQSGLKTTSMIADQLNAQREAVIGVNLDEEAINLVKFQKGYEAAARVINTTSEMLGTLINLGR